MKKSILKSSLLLAASLGSLTTSTFTWADPVIIPSLPTVFCIRITDMEEVNLSDGSLHNDFVLEFEILNWTNQSAAGLKIEQNANTSGASINIVGAGIDRDGRGGSAGVLGEIDASGVGLTTGSGNFDNPAMHSGRGRADQPGFLNDWNPILSTGNTAIWSTPFGGTRLPFRDLLGSSNPTSLVPVGLGVDPALDGTGDFAIDGGFNTIIPATELSEPGNVLDGFTLTIQNWEIGENFGFNFELINAAGGNIGTQGNGNAFGFGSVVINRNDPFALILNPLIHTTGQSLAQTQLTFFNNTNLWNDVTGNSFDFSAEIAAGVSVPLQVQVPVPATLLMLVIGGLGFSGRKSFIAK